MKIPAALLLCALAPLSVPGQISTEAPSAQITVSEKQAYADRSAQELRQIRQQLDEITRGMSLADEPRYAGLYNALDEADEAVAELRIASYLDFNARKSDVDAARQRAARAWQDLRRAEQPADASSGNEIAR